MGERPPIHSGLSSLRKIILKALTENQIVLLGEIEKNSSKTITSLINNVSRKQKIPLSTLKLNARILRDMELIQYSTLQPVALSILGKSVLEIVR